MADLELDLDDLTRLRSTVVRVRENFSRAPLVSQDIADLTGHDGLADKVRQFADNWKIGREKLDANLNWVSEALKSIIDTFNDLDRSLAKEATSLGEKYARALAEHAPATDTGTATGTGDSAGSGSHGGGASVPPVPEAGPGLVAPVPVGPARPGPIFDDGTPSRPTAPAPEVEGPFDPGHIAPLPVDRGRPPLDPDLIASPMPVPVRDDEDRLPPVDRWPRPIPGFPGERPPVKDLWSIGDPEPASPPVDGPLPSPTQPGEHGDLRPPEGGTESPIEPTPPGVDDIESDGGQGTTDLPIDPPVDAGGHLDEHGGGLPVQPDPAPAAQGAGGGSGGTGSTGGLSAAYIPGDAGLADVTPLAEAAGGDAVAPVPASEPWNTDPPGLDSYAASPAGTVAAAGSGVSAEEAESNPFAAVVGAGVTAAGVAAAGAGILGPRPTKNLFSGDKTEEEVD